MLDDEQQLIVSMMKQNGMDLKSQSAKNRANRDIVMAAVTQNGLSLQFASDELRADNLIVNAATTSWMSCVGRSMSDDFLLSIAYCKQRKQKRIFFNEKLNKLGRTITTIHRNLLDANIQATVDLWLIKNKYEDMISAKPPKRYIMKKA